MKSRYTKKRDAGQLAIILLSALILLSLLINFTLSYFMDSGQASTGGNEMKFGSVSMKTDILEQTTTVEDNIIQFDITADEVCKDNVYKTLVLTNRPNNQSSSFVLRIKFSMLIDNVESDLASVSISNDTTYWSNNYSDYLANITSHSSTNWTIGKDGKFYCNQVIYLTDDNGNDLTQYIPLLINFTNDFNNVFTSAIAKVELEAVQYVNDGYLEVWSSTERPDLWQPVA